ncbi:MAG: serine hydrolase [Spirochaetota bacterium]
MRSVIGAAALLVTATGFLWAQQMGPKDVLDRLFTAGADAVQYTEQFTSALPASQLQRVLDQVAGQLGEYQEVRGDSNPYAVVFSGGTATTYIQLDDQGRLAGLRFTQLVPAARDLEEAVSKLKELPGETAVLVTRDGSTVARHNADEPLAVGSTFKLAVLAAVQDRVAAGNLAWDDVVTVQDDWRSLPTGILQDWPTGAAVTIETLATLMISRSDNTATDALIDIVRRRTVEEHAPHSRPFLTTREAFVLKDPDNADLKEEFLSASESDARRVLRRTADEELPEAGLFAGDPVSPEIEWFFSVHNLCGLMEQVADLDLTTANPGLVSKEQWERASYKGGSEPGVLNLTTRLVHEDGTVYCVSATQNRSDDALDQAAFFAAYQGIIGALGE